MFEGLTTQLKHAWNAFRNKDPTVWVPYDIGVGSGIRPDKFRSRYGNERSIINSIINKIAIDVASIRVRHVRIDDNGNFLTEVNSHLNYCLSTEANLDQTARAFFQDVVASMCDEGVVAIVPVDTTFNPEVTGSYDIETMRTGKILQWYPRHIQVRVYNERTGKHEDLTLEKQMVGIVENPLYSIMNEPNSTLKRLIDKLNLLDVADNQNCSGKLNMILQMPYVVRGDVRKKQAGDRLLELEKQLETSKYGIGYMDGTEKITQLNRPLENGLMAEIEYLSKTLYSQLGITESIFDGTADEKTILNYNNRTIEPIMSAIVDEINRKFLTKTARSQKQKIMFFRDPFRLVPIANIADIADKFTRNEILSSNEVRQIVGMKPSEDPNANALRNKNMPVSDEPPIGEQNQNGSLGEEVNEQEV